MQKFVHVDLFAGIGGMSLAVDTVWGGSVDHLFCDIEPFSQAVLKKHWPDSPIYGDIKTLDGTLIGPVDIVTGGFPCQPFSNAGKRKGTADDRNLWPEMFRIIREVHPRWIIGENVDGLVTWNGGLVLESILADLASEGYGTQSFIIPAAAVQAPHRRDRLWVVAHADSSGRVHGQTQKLAAKTRKYALSESIASGADVADTDRKHSKRSTKKTLQRKRLLTPKFIGGSSRQRSQWPIEPTLGRVAHGVPNRVDRIKSLGNAIVPQVAAEIMRAIKAVDQSL